MRKLLVVTVLFVCMAAGTFYYWKQSKVYVPDLVPHEIDSSNLQTYKLNAPPTSHIFPTLNSSLSALSSSRAEFKVPSSELNLKLSFFSQAPFGDWSLPWQEACEEASSLLVANMYHKKSWTREEFNQEILKIVEWEKQKFGAYEHTDVEQTVTMLKEYLGLESIVHTDPSFDDLKKIISQGHFIIAPLAGQEIANPFFTNGGPVYHMLVIKGYKENKVITHDVGTRNGENYVYSWAVINSALHDYAEPIQKGAKKFIEVLPPNS